MTRPPWLTIGIPTFNGGDSITETLESIASQVADGVEVLVSDNGSTDSTAEILSALQSRWPWLRVIRQHENVGYDRNVDAVVRHARGQFVWLFADDDLMAPEAVERLRPIVRDFPNHAVIYMDSLETHAPVPSDIPNADGNEFFLTTKFRAGGISANVINRNLWNSLPLAQFFGSAWIHVAYLILALRERKAYVCNASYKDENPKASKRWMGGGRFFTTGLKIVRLYQAMDPGVYSPQTRRLALECHTDTYWRMIPRARAEGLPLNLGLLREMVALFGDSPRFWLLHLPLMLLPGFLYRPLLALYDRLAHNSGRLPPHDLPVDSETSRLRSYLLGSAGQYLQFAVGTLVNLASVPLALSYFGVERYGAFALIGTLLAYLAASDAGLSAAGGIIAAKTSGIANQRRIVLRSSALCALMAGTFLAALLAFGRSAGFWTTLMGKVSPAVGGEISAAAFCAASLFLIALPLGALIGGFAAAGKLHIERGYSIAGTLLGFLSLIITVALGRGLLFFFALKGASNLLTFSFGVVHYLTISSGEVSRGFTLPPVRDYLMTGLRLLMIGMASLFVWNIDNLVISHLLGIERVTPYAVTFRLISFGFAIFTGLNVAMQPLYGQAEARTDPSWIQRSYERICMLLPPIAGIVLLSAAAFARPVIHLWVGSDGWAGQGVVIALGAYGFLMGLSHSHMAVLTGINRLERASYIAWAEGIANLLISLALISTLGLPGVALGTFLGSLLTTSWMLPVEVARATGGNVHFPIRHVARHALLLLAPSLAVILLAQQLPLSGAGLGGLCVGVMLVYSALSLKTLPASLARELAQRIPPGFRPLICLLRSDFTMVQ